MAYVTEKAIAWRDELASELAIRLSGFTITKAFSSDGNPNLSIGAGTTDSDSMFIKISSIATSAVDVLGLAQNSYTPHQAQVAIETGSTGALDSTRYAVWAVLALKGVQLQLWEVAHGTGPSETVFATPSNLKLTFYGHAQYPQSASL